jgi:hypothetical protein
MTHAGGTVVVGGADTDSLAQRPELPTPRETVEGEGLQEAPGAREPIKP